MPRGKWKQVALFSLSWKVVVIVIVVISILTISDLIYLRAAEVGSTTSTLSTFYGDSSSTEQQSGGHATYTSVARSSATYSATTTVIHHVIVIVMENAEYDQVMSSSDAPYEVQLANKYALATQYYGVSHPSLPNYLALIGGSTFGISDDAGPQTPGLADSNLVDLLVARNVTWKAYMESMPAPCSLSDSWPYAVHHNPFVYFEDIQQTSRCSNNVVPLSSFLTDLNANQLPEYAFIVPNLNNDGHDTTVSYGDTWLSSFVPRIINSSEFASTALFIVYDEGTSDLNGGGHVYCVLVSPFARMGFKSSTTYSHYSLLATTEAIYGLGNLARNDATSPIMKDMFSVAI